MQSRTISCLGFVALLATAMSAEELPDRDNRWDASGGWASHIGVISILHYADTLSFSYSAVFGPTAHLCDGAGVAGLVGRDRYEWEDEEGTVAFQIDEKGVRVEVEEGVASFCGAGWAGDIFTVDGFKPVETCTVLVDRSYFHVTELPPPERRRAYVVQGDKVDTAPLRNEGGERFILARFRGPKITTVGLLLRDDLDCPPEKLGPPWD
jgi:hypothetical protein